MLITMPKLYGYQIAGEDVRVPGVNFDYVIGGNGLFLRAQRTGLSVCFPLEDFEVRGLPDITPTFEMEYETVPVERVQEMISMSRYWAERGVEDLFHFTLDESGAWEFHEPEQVRSGGSCRPLHDGPDSTHERAFIEAHSHHRMRAYFSAIDDRDETGFRIYAVLGDIPSAPKIRVRVGVYSYFWEIPAHWVFELPVDLSDCFEG